MVELGTYWGTSFFAFCQAVKDFNLPAECIAIDTWKGDKHTGDYDPEAYDTFCRIRKKVFSQIHIRDLKMAFEAALPQVEDGSVDLLHIDGCHEYDAVKKDFESWLPKVKQNGIVLFHDVAQSVEYGSAKYWQEVSVDYPHITFQHSWGLGILFPKGQEVFQRFQANQIEDKIKIYEYRSELEYTRVYFDRLRERVFSRDRFIKDQQDLLLEKDELIAQTKGRVTTQKRLTDELSVELKRCQRELETEKQHRTRLESSLLVRFDRAVKRRLGI